MALFSANVRHYSLGEGHDKNKHSRKLSASKGFALSQANLIRYVLAASLQHCLLLPANSLLFISNKPFAELFWILPSNITGQWPPNFLSQTPIITDVCASAKLDACASR